MCCALPHGFTAFSTTQRMKKLLQAVLPVFSFSLSPPLPLPPSAPGTHGLAVSRLAQRTGRHMGGLFCNPSGHTTLAQGEGGEGGGDRASLY
ncbi:hypothetical protein F7725_018937 [Dissostichus mawsoni]|uniref:Uncharacterized protein n=1 Tax=Dissostichus mawsoni TaxID=36200 RepID=A0A7J5XT01_DISMA|nr:hypothetical protein F7725_018937 [Dissostichus mawsoni]